MNNFHVALMLAGALLINNVFADEIEDQQIEEVIVTSSYVDQTLNEIDNPLHVVSGEDISNTATQSLGESLDNLLGVSSTDYGSAVGQPVIRGLSGNRVKILNNNRVVRDVSVYGADHINDIDLNNIQQIEVVRGPSSLLYSNGTVGGIINVVDNTIARKDFKESVFKIGLEAQSVNDGDTYDLSYQNLIGGVNLSLAYKDSDFGNFDIPNNAVLRSEEAHEGEDENADEDHEENLSYLPNSDHASTSARFGLSKTGSWGYVGVSLSNVESLYGIPFHEEAEEEHEEGEEETDEEEHADERVFSDTDSNVFNVEGAYVFKNSRLQKIEYFFRDSDYSLTEEEDGHEEGPTIFNNDAREYGVVFDLTNNTLSQKVVLNFVEEDVSIIGVEAYMNPAENEETSLGYYISKDIDSLHWGLGLRYDQISRKGSIDRGNDIERFDRDITNTSVALNLGKAINEFWGINFDVAVVERAPSAVALLINGPHLATSRFEVGNTALESETSNNIGLTFNYDKNGFFAVLALFRNDVDNYIYLSDSTEDERQEGLILSNYSQQDAQLNGYEFELGKSFELNRGSLSISFGRDSVTGEFNNGNHIPRIIPSRNIYALSYAENDLEFKLSLKDVEEQRDVSISETTTNGYQMLDATFNKTFNLNAQNSLNLSVFANNLLDEVARNHTSFVKDQVPLAGRNYGIKLSFAF